MGVIIGPGTYNVPSKMPLYEYECDACGARFELIRKFSDPPAETCKKCGAGPVRKLVSSPAFQFKGSGWYITDYARKGESESSKKDSGSKDAASKEQASKESASDKPSSDKTSTDKTSGDKSSADKPAATPAPSKDSSS
jgi:putative FmdB family regulatory protein